MLGVRPEIFDMSHLQSVREFMDTYVHTIHGDMDILAAVDFLLANRVTSAPVVNEAYELVGILSEKDCLRILSKGVECGRPHGVVADFMTRDVTSIPPTMDIYYVAGLFLNNFFRRLPVVEDGKLIGAITRFDILRVIQGNLSGERASHQPPVVRSQHSA